MSRILLDQSVQFLVRKFLKGHEVKPAFEMGWATLANGDLLKAAETEAFAVMVTCDQDVRYQQNMATRAVGLVVVLTNNGNVLRCKADLIGQAADGLPPRGCQYIECGLPLRRPR